jgi:hypothetical protein
LQKIAQELTPNVERGRPSISPQKKLLVTIWHIAHQDTIHRISDRFNITDSSVLRCRNQVFHVVLHSLKKKFIYLPLHENVKNKIMDDFYTSYNFPNVLGAIDGTHIRIVAPHEHPQAYVNRKKFHSIILQGLCARNLQFLHVVAGWPGSVHDARVLRNSDIWNICPNWCGPDNHIIGDGAYPLQTWLLKPFRNNGHLTRTQRRYNFHLSSARAAIERAFGLLKGRFRRLLLLDTKSIKTAVDTIMVCCIFHNICIINDDILDQYIADGREEDLVVPEIYGENDDVAGLQKQIRIANTFQ